MSLDAIVPQLLQHPAVTAAVGGRVALNQLPPGTDYPAIVWTIISEEDDDYLDSATQAPIVRGVVQFNPLAKTYGAVKDLHAVLARVLDERHQVSVAGSHVLRVSRQGLGQPDRDNDAGVWTRPADYMILFEGSAPQT